MGDELRGENLVHLNVRFSTETELKKIQDFLYEKSGQGVSFTGLVEAMVNEVTIVTAVHNIKSNKGSKTAGVDKIKMDKCANENGQVYAADLEDLRTRLDELISIGKQILSRLADL